MPAALILRLARTSRWAIVARRRGRRGRSRRCVRPPSVRRVSATWASMASAGWQQVKMSSSRSSGKVVVVHRVLRRLGHARAGGSSRPACGRGGCGRSPGCAPSSRARRRGWSGSAVARPALGGDRERLLRGFLGEVEVAEEADQGSRGRGPTRRGRPARGSLPLHDRAHLDRAAHAGRRDPRASSIAASRSSASKKR